MSVFEWDGKFSVGLASIDYQHRGLVVMINALAEAVSVGSDEEKLRRIVAELYDYTEYHFTTEEEMMLAAGPRLRDHYREHKAAHDDFTSRIRPLRAAPLNAATLNEALFDFLVRWLIDHILGSDKEMGHLVRQTGEWSDGPAPAAADGPHGAIVADEHRDAVERSLLGALKESEVRFRNLSDGVPVLISVCDADGRRTLFNRTWRTFSGLSDETLRHEGWREAIHPDDRPAYEADMVAALQSRAPFSRELRLRRADGRYRWMLETSVPRLGEDGSYLGLIGSAVDITERKQAERVLLEARRRLEQEVARQTAELRSANQRLEVEKEEQRQLIDKLSEAQAQLLQSEKLASIGQLAAGVAHEINNPVGFIASNLSTLEHYAADLMRLIDAYVGAEAELAASGRQAIEEVKHAIELDYLRGDLMDLIHESREGTTRVKQIVQSLKDFSHVDEAEWQWADLNQGLDSTLTLVHNELKYRAEVVKAYGDLPPVHCIPAQINQVFMNLLINAAQAITQKGTITLRTGHEGDAVWVEISDTGCGIPAGILHRIFDPFFTTKPVGQGTGLGLSLSYGIVNKHDGRVDVTSEPGRGTTFRVTLPVAGPADEARQVS